MRKITENGPGKLIKEIARLLRDFFLAGRGLAVHRDQLALDRVHDAPNALDVLSAVPGELDNECGHKHLKDNIAGKKFVDVALHDLPGSRFIRGKQAATTEGDSQARKILHFAPTFRLAPSSSVPKVEAAGRQAIWRDVDLRQWDER